MGGAYYSCPAKINVYRFFRLIPKNVQVYTTSLSQQRYTVSLRRYITSCPPFGGIAHFDGTDHSGGIAHFDGSAHFGGNAHVDGTDHSGGIAHVGGTDHSGGIAHVGGTDHSGGIAHFEI